MLHELHQPAFIEVVAGRNRSWSGSLCGASLELPLSRQCPHRVGVVPCTCSPTQNPACRFPAPGSPGRTHSRASSDRRMTEFRVRQFKPRAVHEVAPEQPMSLAASAQYSDPLQLYLAPNHVEFRLAVVQPEILIETTQHHRQVTLLIPPLPVPMSREPLLGARQKLSTALLARETDHRELAAVSDSTYMLETQKVKRAGSLVVCCFSYCSEASEEQQPCFLVGQFQVESRESFPQISIEVFRIPLVLETCHKIVSEPKQISFPSKPISHLLLEPKIEHKVQIYVGQEWTEWPPCGVPSPLRTTTPSCITPALSHLPCSAA